MTNSFGNKRSSAFGKFARSFTVPVLVSTWLSIVSTLPVASFLLSDRSYASTASDVLPFSFSRIGWMSSSATVKITEIGLICVITTSPLVSDDVT